MWSNSDKNEIFLLFNIYKGMYFTRQLSVVTSQMFGHQYFYFFIKLYLFNVRL